MPASSTNRGVPDFPQRGIHRFPSSRALLHKGGEQAGHRCHGYSEHSRLKMRRGHRPALHFSSRPSSCRATTQKARPAENRQRGRAEADFREFQVQTTDSFPCGGSNTTRPHCVPHRASANTPVKFPPATPDWSFGNRATGHRCTTAAPLPGCGRAKQADPPTCRRKR